VRNIFKAAFIILLFSGCTSQKHHSGIYKAGFKTFRAFDKSRTYKPDTDTSDQLHYRPVDIDFWYPVDASLPDTFLSFSDILSLLEKRAVFYTGSDSWKGITAQVAQSFCEGFKCSDTAKLLNYKTRSMTEAIPSEGRFPLVIYLCAYNGMGFENFRLFEELAEKGYAVLSVSSIGRFPGDMTMKKEDLLEQIYDAEFSLKEIMGMPDIDFSKKGIIGYSWGGLAGSMLAGRIQDAACIISLDGSEYHHYTEAEQENNDFNDITTSEMFKELRLTAPYLRLESSPGTEAGKKDSVYAFTEKLAGERQFFRIDSARHEDFSCLSLVVPESGNCISDHAFETTLKLVLPFLDEYLKEKEGFLKAVNENSKTVHRIEH
jgi:hypothetical protein